MPKDSKDLLSNPHFHMLDAMKYIAVGKIVKTHGLEGYVKAISYSGIVNRFEDLRIIYSDVNGEMRGWIVENLRITGGESLLKLRGVNDRDAAKALVKKEIWLPESQKIDLPDDMYFIHELIGLQVFDIAGKYLGVLEDVLSGTGTDIYVVRQENKNEILVPAVSEFIKEIDLGKQRIRIQLIEGMVE